MTKQFAQRNIKLSLEFDSYLHKHPELYDSIPNGAVVVITLKSDKKFNENSFAVVRKYPTKQLFVKAEKYKSEWTLQPLQLAAV